GAMPRNVTPPGIAADHDAPKVGDVLGVDAGTWAGPDSDGRRYQWLRCDASGDACLPIAGASGATYELTPADAGARLRVVELAVGEAGTQGARSAASELISTVPSPVF